MRIFLSTALAILALCAVTASPAATGFRILGPHYLNGNGTVGSMDVEFDWTRASNTSVTGYRVRIYSMGSSGSLISTVVCSGRNSTNMTYSRYDLARGGYSWSVEAIGTGNTKTGVFFVTAPRIATINDRSEWVLIENIGSSGAWDMTDWELTDGYWSYIFPSFVLEPGEHVYVHTGTGTNNAHNLYWGYGSSVWNDDGDTGYLYDENGDLMDSYTYR